MYDLIKFLLEKLMYAVKYSGGQALELFNKVSGGEAVVWFHKTFPPETRAAAADKIGYWQASARSFGAEMVTWFDKIFPPETRAEKLSHWIRVGKPYLIAAVVLVVVYRLFGGGGKGKMMKAPGRNYKMPRRDFVSNPKGYFSDLRRRRR